MKLNYVIYLVIIVLALSLISGCTISTERLLETSYDIGCDLKSYQERGSMRKIECHNNVEAK